MNNYELVEGLDRPEYILKNGKALNIYGAKKILEAQEVEIAELKAIVNEFIEEFSCFVAQHECNCGHPSCRTCRECRDAFKLLDKTPAQCLQSEKADAKKKGARTFRDEMLAASKCILHPHIEGVFAVYESKFDKMIEAEQLREGKS